MSKQLDFLNLFPHFGYYISYKVFLTSETAWLFILIISFWLFHYIEKVLYRQNSLTLYAYFPILVIPFTIFALRDEGGWRGLNPATQRVIIPECDSTSCISRMWLNKLYLPNVTQQAVPPECDSTSCISQMWLNKLYLPNVTQQAVPPECDSTSCPPPNVTQQAVPPESDSTSCTSQMWLNKLYLPNVHKVSNAVVYNVMAWLFKKKSMIHFC